MSVNKYGILHTHTQTKVERECRRERKKSMHTQNKTPKKHSDKMKMNEKWFMFNVAWKIFRWLFCLYADILWRKCRTFITWFCVVAFISSLSHSLSIFFGFRMRTGRKCACCCYFITITTTTNRLEIEQTVFMIGAMRENDIGGKIDATIEGKKFQNNNNTTNNHVRMLLGSFQKQNNSQDKTTTKQEIEPHCDQEQQQRWRQRRQPYGTTQQKL